MMYTVNDLVERLTEIQNLHGNIDVEIHVNGIILPRCYIDDIEVDCGIESQQVNIRVEPEVD